MQVSVENTGSLSRRMTVAVPAERFEQAFTSRLERLSKQVKVPGFRPGKVPMKVIEARYGGRVMEEVAGELIQATFREAVGQEGLKPVVTPAIEHQPIERGKDFAYTARFEVYPEIPKLDLAGHVIERPRGEITSDDVDRSVESLRQQRVVWQPVEREARQGDRLTISFKGTVDGQPFEGGEANDLHLVLGSGRLIEGFEDGLTGVSSGDTRTLALQFPDAHPKKELAGKPVEFVVDVQAVAEPVLPEVNEEFARQFGIVEGSVEKLRAQVRVNLEREMAQRLRAVLRARVLEALVNANEFDLPQTLLAAETDYVRRLDRAVRDPKENVGTETPDESAAYEMTARRRLARSLTLAEVIRVNAIKADPDKVRARVTEMAQEYEAPEEFVRACYATPARLSQIEAAVVEEQAVERLLETADVSEKSVTFQELVRLGTAAS